MKFSLLPKELEKRLKKYPEIKWDIIVCATLEKYVEKLEATENEKEIEELTKLSEYSLKEFLESEPDLYTEKDLKQRY